MSAQAAGPSFGPSSHIGRRIVISAQIDAHIASLRADNDPATEGLVLFSRGITRLKARFTPSISFYSQDVSPTKCCQADCTSATNVVANPIAAGSALSFFFGFPFRSGPPLLTRSFARSVDQPEVKFGVHMPHIHGCVLSWSARSLRTALHTGSAARAAVSRLRSSDRSLT